MLTKALGLEKGSDMKRTLSWVMWVGAAGLVVALLLSSAGQKGSVAIAEAAKEQPAKAGKTSSAPAAQPSAPSGASSKSVDTAAKPETEKIVYTFGDQAKLDDFTNLWRQRQGSIVRMTVLQSYWNQEQAALTQLNNKFATDYKLDVTKNYTLDDKRRVLIEREGPPASVPAAPQAQALGAQANPPATR